MSLHESLLDGLTEVRTHKARTLLQTLGVVLGVASLVAVQGLVDAGRRQTMSYWSQTGGLTKLLVVNRPVRETVATARQLASSGLTWDDAQVIRAEVPHVIQVDPIAATSLPVRYRDYRRTRHVAAVTPDYTAVYKFYPARGRFLAADDLESRARVVVLGDSAARTYFGNEDPLGRTIYLDDVGFTVVGIMERKEFYFEDGDNNALEWMNQQTMIPLTALYTRFTGDSLRRVEYINVIIDRAENNESAVKAIEGVLHRRHGGVSDFEVHNRSARMAQAQEQDRVFDVTFLVTGIVSLIVGGIVIMNIMLASFQERVREVGIRKAIGATGRDVALQFLVESVLVTCIGGAAGLLLGIGFAQGITELLGVPTEITPRMALIGVVASVSTGLVFGMAPALKAGRLNPVDALRYEMNFGEILRTTFVEIRHHKLRSVLTMLGIILGTLSITVMTSFLDGIVVMVWEGFSDLGFDGVMYVAEREARDLNEQSLFARSRGLQPADAELIRVRADRVGAVAPVMMHEELLRADGVERVARVFGVTSDYQVVRERKLAEGRFIGESDDDSYARVCVLGHRLKRRLFGSTDAIGKTVAIGGRSFRVVGVAAKLGNQFVDSDDFIEEMEGIYVPLTTLRKLYTGEDAPLAFIAIKTGALERLGDVKAELIAALRLAHRGAEDFRVQNIAEDMLRERDQVTTIIRSWRIVLGCLAGISLVVGGIGLLSVMLISIGERLYEIGLRKAIGATDGQIFLQFLLEAVALSLVGGILGTACGVLVTRLAGSVFPGGLPVYPGGLLLAVATSIGLGVVYGIYPALRASRMAPVDALRSLA